MLRYTARRLLWVLPTIFAVVLASFSLLHLVPGDPARVVAGIDAPREIVEQVRRELGLDEPLVKQFAEYVIGVVQLDFGTSIHTGRPVTEELLSAAVPSMELAIAAMVIAVIVGIPLGVAAAYHRGRLLDLLTSGFAALGVAAPAFWVGIMLVAAFSVNLGWFPSGGRGSVGNLILPSITLALLPLALIARLTRSAVLEVLEEDYVRTARAKGVKERSVLLLHVLRNASPPIITITGLEFGSILSGATVVETVFAWPGVGRLLVEAIFRRDFPIVQAGVLVIAVFFILINLLTDLAHVALDPRVEVS